MKTKNFNLFSYIILALTLVFIHTSARSQPLNMTRDEIIQYTPLWKGERFPDGRPKVPDDIINRMRYVPMSVAWQTIHRQRVEIPVAKEMAAGYHATNDYGPKYCYYGEFKQMYENVTICGRAVTMQTMPLRPDVNIAIQQQGQKEGLRMVGGTYAIDILEKGDVYVVNFCEGLMDGSHVGDNLGNSIYRRSGNGAIIRGTVRDREGCMEIDDKGFNLFVRDFRPESGGIGPYMVVGRNLPIQIGYVTVMPGDVVLAKQEGVLFIPPHMAEQIVVESEKSGLLDRFAHTGVQEGRFTASQADGQYTEAMHKEFDQWLRDNIDNMEKFYKDPRMTPSKEFIRAYIKERESGIRFRP